MCPHLHSPILHSGGAPEPVFVEGEPTFTLWADQWTRSTVDGGWSAQTEHTVLITNRGAEILTSA